MVNALLQRGHEPVAALSDKPRHALRADVPTLRLDLTRPKSIMEALDRAGVDTVIHCAAYGVDYREQDLDKALRINVVGTLQLFDAAHRAGIGRFLHVGTSYEYGDHPGPISETMPLLPDGLYASTKAAASLLLLGLRRRTPPKILIVRPFGMYGPGEGSHKLVPQVLSAVSNSTPLDLTDGTEVRDYVPVNDVARGVAELAVLPEDEFPAGHVFNVCSGNGRSVRDFVSALAVAAGGDLAMLRFGRLPNRPDAPARVVGDPTRWRAFWDHLGRSDVAAETALADVVTQMQKEA